MTLGAPRPSPLVEQAAANLREQISCGHWPVGTRLPGETTLAKTLGVGRSTVREALRALAGAGLVQPRQGAGVFVIASRPVEDWPTRLRRAAAADVCEVRTLLEAQAARLAAVRRTDADLAALRAALETRRAAARGDGAAFVEADLALRTAVVAAAHNPVLTDLFAQLAPALRQAPATPPDLSADEGPTALIDAITAADPDAAARALTAERDETRTPPEAALP
ncbi:FadR/GntR family transcriptional regulator [Streptomyces sp. NPDC054887]